jgi:hypothetical protein
MALRISIPVMPRFMPLLSGLDRGGSPNYDGFLGEIQEDSGSRRARSPGRFALFVGGRVEPGHDGKLLNLN